MAKAEEVGAEGQVEESMKMLEEVEALKVKKTQAELEFRNSMPASSYQQQKLRVCEVCGAYLGIHDNDRRLADHFGGKLHLGFITIREKLDLLKTIRKWVKAVSEGRDDMEDEPRPGRPVTACGDAKISTVLVSLSDDRRKTCEEISMETSMSRTSVFRVLTNKLNKKEKFSKWYPHLLTDEQKASRVNFSRNFLRRFQTEQNDFLGRIITSDETWVYSWDPETKRQSAEWRDFDEPRPEKVRRKQGALKVMHMIFFYMNGVILRWPVPIGTSINAVLQEGAARQTQTCHSKEMTWAVGVRHLVSPRQCASPYGWSILAIHLTLPPVIFTYSLKSKNIFAAGDLKQKRTLFKLRK
ncbi:LUC7-like (S. cerevisiae) [Elysia marginata]|uniref:LUC7-like (S. cerevisiae) n=1 Tax=Elysia marginata TaxID=1093978 RepID=A0AAV4H0T6_9GAST|nr:LUC7-like (S. cerevisiae) [Elysia marginata]